MTHPFRATMALVAGLVAYGSAAQAQGDPPGRVGRLAFAEGSVSFHDQDDSAWSKAVVNTPLTSGDSVWTEPNAHSELSVAGTRLRLDGGTQLDVLALDDSQTRLQLGQGRLDVKTYTLDTKTPYQIVTPRGTITLQQQGDYYVEAGSTQDATRLGVRSGSAQLLSLNGQTLTVRAGEVGEIYGDVGTPQLRTVNSAPPALPTYWAARDRQVTYDPPTQYLSAGMTGYEDMNAYGSWSNDSQYGSVWTPRSVPSDWQPYHSGHWSNVKPWGWTWIDDQPWGYAPYHYGRWANRNNHWVWIPPQRDVQPVYAPALVAFIGGIELSVTLGNPNNAPVGWFPLGPRETYVPSYTTDRDYYNRINRSAQIQQHAAPRDGSRRVGQCAAEPALRHRGAVRDLRAVAAGRPGRPEGIAREDRRRAGRARCRTAGTDGIACRIARAGRRRETGRVQARRGEGGRAGQGRRQRQPAGRQDGGDRHADARQTAGD
jgi:hypothetical protein